MQNPWPSPGKTRDRHRAGSLSATGQKPTSLDTRVVSRRGGQLSRRVGIALRVAIVTPWSDLRDSALYIAASGRVDECLLLMADVGSTSIWPSSVQRERLSTLGRRNTRQWMWGLEKRVARFEPDLVHVHNEAWALTSQRLLRGATPVVVHGAENLLRDAPANVRLRRLGARRVLANAAGYAAWGHSALAAARLSGLPGSTPSAVISGSPPDPDVFRPTPSRASGDGRLSILFVGRLADGKGLDVLLRAVGSMPSRAAVSVTVVGGGPKEAAWRALARQIEVNVTFRGKLAEAEVHRSMCECDVIVVPSHELPSWREQWGRVVVEAMMTGRAVVTSDCGELPFLVGDPEWVFPQNDHLALARKLELLRSSNGLLGRAAGHAARRGVQYRPDRLADDLLQLWTEVVDRAG